jgi:hypothetical protein
MEMGGCPRPMNQTGGGDIPEAERSVSSSGGARWLAEEIQRPSLSLGLFRRGRSAPYVREKIRWVRRRRRLCHPLSSWDVWRRSRRCHWAPRSSLVEAGADHLVEELGVLI